MPKTILIGGGVGPMAGVALHQAIIEATMTDGRDQSHLSVLHISHSSEIPDRTEFLLGREQRDPGIAMAQILGSAAAIPWITEHGAVAGVPCNTFHAPRILESFLPELAQLAPQLQFINMLTATTQDIARTRPTRIGLLSTTGTRQSGVWQKLLTAEGYQVLQVPEAQQDDLHRIIYDREWGLKAVSPPTATASSALLAMAVALISAGAELLIVACTELPLVIPGGSFNGVPVIDPVRSLARVLVTAAGGPLRLPE